MKGNKYKVVHIISTLRRTGPVNQIYSLAKFIDRDKFQLIIVTLSEEPINSRYDDFENLGIEIHSLNLTRFQMIMYGKKKLSLLLNKINPDLIHTHTLRADYYGAKLQEKYNVCNTIHNYPYEDYPKTHGPIIGGIMSFLHLKSIKGLKHTISCSQSVNFKMKKHGINSKIITNGVDEKVFNPQKNGNKTALKESLNLKSDKIVIISVGNISKLKDPFTIIKAFKESKISEYAELVLLGDGPLVKNCKDMSTKNIHVLGMVKNVQDYLQAADIYVSASTTEGLPMSVIEAMAMELPLILSSIEPHREIIMKNTFMGQLFDVGNEASLREVFDNINVEKLITFGKSSREAYLEYYTASTMATNYELEYENIISSRSLKM